MPAAPFSYGPTALILLGRLLAGTGGGEVFLIDSSLAPSVRVQEVHGAPDFRLPGDPRLLISEISYFVGLSRFEKIDLSDVQISISTTLRAPDHLSNTYAENIGSDETTVYSGRLILLPDRGGEIDIPLQTPFLYDPSQGNLLLDVRNFKTAPPPLGPTTGFYGENILGDTVSIVLGLDANGSVALGQQTDGPLTTFTYTPVAVPEPSTEALLAGGALLLGWCAWRKTRRKAAMT